MRDRELTRLPAPGHQGAAAGGGRTTPAVMTGKEGKLIVEPVQAPHYDLDDLLARVDAANLHAETGTGPPVGLETW